jgi:hypothetical protein
MWIISYRLRGRMILTSGIQITMPPDVVHAMPGKPPLKMVDSATKKDDIVKSSKPGNKSKSLDGSARRRLYKRLENAGCPKHLIWEVEKLGDAYGQLATQRYNEMHVKCNDGTDYA